MLILFIGALVLLVAAVFTYTQSDDAGFNKAKGVLQTLEGDLRTTRDSLNKFVETCEDLTAKLDAVNREVADLKDKQAKIDERLIADKIDQRVTLDTRPISLKPIQVELITRSAPLLDRAGVTNGAAQPTPPPARKVKKQTKGERRAVN